MITSYELLLLYRVMPRPELVSSIKRTANTIYNRGGIIRKLESLGTKDMPYKTSAHGVVYNKASYFLMDINIPPNAVSDVLEEYSRDVDIIRRRVHKTAEPIAPECTLSEELQPPPYRKSVQNLIAKSQKLQKPKFNYNTGLDYYPFQK